MLLQTNGCSENRSKSTEQRSSQPFADFGKKHSICQSHCERWFSLLSHLPKVSVSFSYSDDCLWAQPCFNCHSLHQGKIDGTHHPNLSDLGCDKSFRSVLLNGGLGVSRHALGEIYSEFIISQCPFWTLPTIKHHGSTLNRKKYINWIWSF